jgi:hypothetical protein
VRARLEIEGIREARARTDQVGLRARRPEPALRSQMTRNDLLGSQRRQWASGGRAVGTGWPKDKPSWAAEKRREGLDPRVMRARGRLERVATTGEGFVFRAYNGTLWWGIPARSAEPYAEPLARGARGRRGRRSVVIDPIAVSSIADRTGAYIADGFVR